MDYMSSCRDEKRASQILVSEEEDAGYWANSLNTNILALTFLQIT